MLISGSGWSLRASLADGWRRGMVSPGIFVKPVASTVYGGCFHGTNWIGGGSILAA